MSIEAAQIISDAIRSLGAAFVSGMFIYALIRAMSGK